MIDDDDRDELAAAMAGEGRRVWETCNVCHKPLTARGNRQFWIRTNRWSQTSIVCGRHRCQEEIRNLPDGAIYTYTSYCPAEGGGDGG